MALGQSVWDLGFLSRGAEFDELVSDSPETPKPLNSEIYL